MTESPVRLSDREAKMLRAIAKEDAGIDGEMAWHFRGLARFSGIELHNVRRTIRALARKGLAEYCRGLSNEDGEFYGSGYALTKAGRDLAERMA